MIIYKNKNLACKVLSNSTKEIKTHKSKEELSIEYLDLIIIVNKSKIDTIDIVNTNIIQIIKSMMEIISIKKSNFDEEFNVINELLSIDEIKSHDPLFDEILFYMKSCIQNGKKPKINNISHEFCMSDRKLQLLFKSKGKTYRQLIYEITKESV